MTITATIVYGILHELGVLLLDKLQTVSVSEQTNGASKQETKSSSSVEFSLDVDCLHILMSVNGPNLNFFI